MIVVTRAQAKKQLEEELIHRKREVLSEAKPNPVEYLGKCSDQESSGCQSPRGHGSDTPDHNSGTKACYLTEGGRVGDCSQKLYE